MKIALTNAQLKKVQKGDDFKLTKKQLDGEQKNATNVYEFDGISDRVMKKLKSSKTGVTIKRNEYRGSGLFSSISKSVSKAANSVADTTKDVGSTINKVALKSDLGGIVESAQNIIPESATREAVVLALMAGGMDENQANIAAGTAVGAFYYVDFSKSLKGQGKKALSGGVKGGIKGAKDNQTSGRRLNSVQQKLIDGHLQEKRDSNIRFDKPTRNYNGETIQAHNMVRQVAPMISSGSGLDGNQCPTCGDTIGAGVFAKSSKVQKLTSLERPKAVTRQTNSVAPKKGSEEMR
jgi:hypothetical protein